MLFTKPAVLACLAATATAIDIRQYSSGTNGCTGGYTRCTSINPGVCCSANSQWPNRSLSFNAIPKEWRVHATGYWQEGCTGDVAGSGNSNGQTDMCFPTAKYRAGKYVFVGRKRGGDNEASEGPCQKPDTMVFPDGTTFDLTGLDEQQYDTFMAGGSTTGIENHFTAFRV
ncbi:uncharacterized protein B0I36DRAFT_358835 [Microdochium trichocladiopsis]|uniref:Uncharacterized protein n=1 Tax=Microdochium trichocladiopsis TaxID=1682393 RepID=A0A9P8YCT5_9PEZI|nr:uncharacterized protein B0I36DRAFT_358835 [Microdochium trichocladiopsis]KAH7037085.1 hypothetical protein B0I36DRAFT_358835 [Microdochium trichocladiopsis]